MLFPAISKQKEITDDKKKNINKNYSLRDDYAASKLQSFAIRLGQWW
jgi:hypothetical protein